jgi:cell division protein FtsL
MIRRIPSKQRNALVAREREQDAVLRLGLLLLCGLILAGGFVYAGVQHFAALRVGYQTENLRQVRDQLAEDQRRYLLEREAAASPARLERAARRLGLQALQPAQIDPLRQKSKGLLEKPAPPADQPAQAKSVPTEAQVKPIRLKNTDEASLH